MADDNTSGDNAGSNSAEPEFVMQAVYLKDCSFEAPKGPRVEGQWNPQINLDLNTNAEVIGDDQREIVLTVSVTVKNLEITAFLVEVKQAGLFQVRNLTEADYQRAIAVIAPNVLFPYSRALIAQLCALGGFPQLLLPPVNFEALFAQQVAQAQAGSTARN
jgi:preprotein translocase subunit SecB